MAFWTAGEALAELATNPRSPEVQLGVLRRLGQPPFVALDLPVALGPIYRTVSQRAEALAFPEGEAADAA